MEIPEHKREFFIKNGFPVEEMERVIAELNDDANNVNAPRKEVAAIMATRKKAEEVQPVPELARADMPPEEEEEEEEEDMKKEYVTKEEMAGVVKEVADVVVELVKGQAEALASLQALPALVKELTTRIAALEKTDEEKLAVKKEELPPASLQSIIAERLLREGGQDHTERYSHLMDKKPDETPLTMETFRPGMAMNIPFLDQQIKGGKHNA